MYRHFEVMFDDGSVLQSEAHHLSQDYAVEMKERLRNDDRRIKDDHRSRAGDGDSAAAGPHAVG